MNMHNKVNISRIVSKGDKIYEKIKSHYIEDHYGDFLAIDIDSKEEFLGTTNAEAVEKAKIKHPDTVFYVVRIGHSATETLAAMAKS